LRVAISLPSIEQSYPQRYYVSCPALDLDLVKGSHRKAKRKPFKKEGQKDFKYFNYKK
jgi:hypothetical protein